MVKSMAASPASRQAVTSAVELDKLAGWRGRSLFPEPISLQLPDLPREAAIRWQVILNLQSEACGCTEGLVLALVFTTTYIGYLLVHHSTLIVWATAGTVLALFSIGAVVGKAIGIVRARAQRIQTLRQIRSALHTQAAARTTLSITRPG